MPAEKLQIFWREESVVAEKVMIYYTRTYRHLKSNILKSVLFLVLLVLPVFLLTALNLYRITHFISSFGVSILGSLFPGIPMVITKDYFSFLGEIEYISTPTIYPDMSLILLNFLIVVALMIILGTGGRKGRPVAIFAMLSSVVHLVNCIYFIFAQNYFPYEAYQFSNLYIKQQIGIWLTFILLAGVVTAFLGNRGYLYKILTFFTIMIYSFVFGTIRYVLFLFLLQKFSVLYMAPMYFVFGPLFDFLYFVIIYAVFVDKMVKVYNTGAGRGDWQWL